MAFTAMVGANGASGSFAGNATVTIDSLDLKDGRGEIHIHRLEPKYSDQAAGITTTVWSPVILSDDLQRAAIFDPGVAILSIHDLPSKTMLAPLSCAPPPNTRPSLWAMSMS